MVVASDEVCRCCRAARGFVYVGPVYARESEKLRSRLCPWCVSDGRAASSFAAEFADAGDAVPAGVPRTVIREIATRTPGFPGWQQDRWLYHCGDGAAFLGAVGWAELAELPDAVEMLKRECSDAGWSADYTDDYIAHLSPDGDATAYLFRCRRCGTDLAYSDFL